MAAYRETFSLEPFLEGGISGLVGLVAGWEAMRELRVQTICRPMGVARVAKELRRQERGSHFTGYTTNFTLPSVRQLLQLIGGTQWELSLVPICWIKCWHTRASLVEISKETGWYGTRGLALQDRVRELADRIRKGAKLPGVFLTKSQQRPGSHWILDGHHRLLAHRVAKAPAILAYHPLGMFGAGVGRKVAFAQAH